MDEGPSDVSRQIEEAFSDPRTIASYPDGPLQFVPGVEALHRMTGVLLAERARPDAKILVLGAGGGMELKALAQAHPLWRFTGVDPSAEMLTLAARTLGASAERVELVRGVIDDAPEGPFDGAVCLLTLHFFDPDERLRAVGEIRRRLRAGAPFVAAHNTLPRETGERASALNRYRDYAIASGADPGHAEERRVGIGAFPNMLPPERDEEILRAAGYSNVSLFYAAFSWRGFVAYA